MGDYVPDYFLTGLHRLPGNCSEPENNPTNGP